MKIFNQSLIKTAAIILTVFVLGLPSKSTAQFEIAPQPAAPSTDCISQKDLQDIASHFKQFARLASKEFCNDNSQTWHLLSSMMFMKRTAFDPNMVKSKDDLFSGKFASDWFNYFIGRIDEIEIVDQCEKGVIAYVYSFGGKTMYVCPLALTENFSSLDRASVFMHEARHIDGFPHITCSQGPREGIQGACDQKISDTGSYAVSVETYAQLAKYAQGLNPALRAYAKSSAVVYADEAFETPVQINRTEQLIILTENLDFNVLTVGTLKSEILGKSPLAGKIFKRAQHMVLIPDDKSQKARYVFARNEGDVSQSPGEIITEYNALPVDQKANLVDIHNGAQFTARVYKTSVRFACDPKSPATKDITLPKGVTAASLIYPTGFDRAAKTALLTAQDGSIYEVGCKATNAYVKPSTVAYDQKYTRMYKVSGTVFGLNKNSELFNVTARGSELINLNLNSKIIEIAPFQSYEFFDKP